MTAIDKKNQELRHYTMITGHTARNPKTWNR